MNSPSNCLYFAKASSLLSIAQFTPQKFNTKNCHIKKGSPFPKCHHFGTLQPFPRDLTPLKFKMVHLNQTWDPRFCIFHGTHGPHALGKSNLMHFFGLVSSPDASSMGLHPQGSLTAGGPQNDGPWKRWPQSYPPQKYGLIKGLLTIGFP